ncbi:MAG: diaminopimelate epimerase [Armatimonadota bacterium]
MSRLAFTKMHGCGNDFILVDAFETSPPTDAPALARQLNDRHCGIGGDGLILVLPGNRLPFKMRMFNPDGTEAEMCGNGIRCFARLVHERGYANREIQVETGAGDLTLLIEEGLVRVDMGIAKLLRGEIPMTGPAAEPAQRFQLRIGERTLEAAAVNMGNPHCVVPMEAVDDVPLSDWGPPIESNTALFPERTNVHFVQVLSPTEIKQRTWERGAGATLACGTGACASAVACHNLGLTERAVTVHLPGGDLRIEYEQSGRVWMIGPAEYVYDGVWEG